MENSDVISTYVEITKECPIAQIGPPYSYYFADETSSNILGDDIIEVDIKSAFPTICRILFGKDHPFVQEIFKESDKLKRNIYISTTLKAQSKIDNRPYLVELNLWSKMLLFTYIYSKYDSVQILQYVKDGAIIKAKLKDSVTPLQKSFLQYVANNNIIYHEDPIKYYIRFHRTSILYVNNGFVVKGEYRSLPKFIQDVILPRFFKGEIYVQELMLTIKKIYNPVYFTILHQSGLGEDIEYYYMINKDKYLNSRYALDSLDNIAPKVYLISIIYPILSLFRSRQSSS